VKKAFKTVTARAVLMDSAGTGWTLGSVMEGYANWQADGLENRCPKGLGGSSPSPSATKTALQHGYSAVW
jgi:hypothetical protein